MTICKSGGKKGKAEVRGGEFIQIKKKEGVYDHANTGNSSQR